MFRTAIVSLAVMALSSAASAAPLDPMSIRHDIQARGSKTVVDETFKSGTWETVLIKRIAAGSAPWIKLAPVLAEGTDAATSEELGDALVHALPKAPGAVLSVLDLSVRFIPRAPETVCSASFYEGDPTNPRLYKAAALRAVGGVTDPALASAKQACLADLR